MYLPDWDYRAEYINTLEKECQKAVKNNHESRIADIDFVGISPLGEDVEITILSYGWLKEVCWGEERVTDVYDKRYDDVFLTLDIDDDKKKILETVAANYHQTHNSKICYNISIR